MEAWAEAAVPVLVYADGQCEVEAAAAARHADKAGHHADLGRETLRDELEHGAVTSAEREHRDDEQAERRGKRGGLRYACAGSSRDHEHGHTPLDSADLVRHGTAPRPYQRTRD